MKYMIENNYTDEIKGFITATEAWIYLNKEIRRLNDNYGKDCWSIDDFTVYEFDAKNCKWIKI